MKDETWQAFENSVEVLCMVHQVSIRDFKEALYELQSFDKVIQLCLISKEMGIPLWEVIQEGKETMNYYYEQIQKDVRQCWTNATFH